MRAAADEAAAPGRSPLYATIESRVRQEYARLSSSKIDCWRRLAAGGQMRCTKFAGEEIHYGGIEFPGTPRQVFWGGFIEPFLRQAIEDVFEFAADAASRRGCPVVPAVRDAEYFLRSLNHWVYNRMHRVEVRLLAAASSREEPADIDPKIQIMDGYVRDVAQSWTTAKRAAGERSGAATRDNRPKAERRRGTNRHLTDLQEDYLKAMAELGATERALRRSARQIAKVAIGRAGFPSKDIFVGLRRARLVGSALGRLGGYWLNAKGAKIAARLK